MFGFFNTTIAKRLVPECGLQLCTTEGKEDIIEIREMTKEQRPGHAPAPEPDSPRQIFQNRNHHDPPASENLEEFNNVRPAAPEGRLEGGAQHDYWELASI
eukprot:gene10530-21841_t